MTAAEAAWDLESGFNDKLNEENGRSLQAIWLSMVGTDDFFLHCIADEAMGLIKYNNIVSREAIVLQREQ